ncbi:MAG: hypothetical protein SNH79_04485 [Rikenellaceae bacterium]
MRQFTAFEKKVMKRLVEMREVVKDPALFFAQRVILNCMDYRLMGFCQNEIRIVSDMPFHEDVCREMYLDLRDLLVLFDDLKDLGCITLCKVPAGKPEELLLNHSHYSTSISVQEINSTVKSLCEDGVYSSLLLFPGDGIYEKILLDYAHFLMLYPTSTLLELVNNDFKSAEQRRFERQMRWTCASVFIAAVAAIISAIALITK